MRNLLRNNQPVFYRLYQGEEEIKDQFGNATGSFIPKYSELKSAMLTVSPNKGSSEVDMFGSLEDYDRTMSTADTSVEIDEDSVLWIDGVDTNGPHNAIVKLRAPWKNSVTFAIKHITVSQYEAQQAQIAAMKESANAAYQRQIEQSFGGAGDKESGGISEEG